MPLSRWHWMVCLLAGCATSGSATAPQVSVGEVASERIARLLEQHHLVGGPMTRERAQRLARGVWLAIGGAACAQTRGGPSPLVADQLADALRRGNPRLVRDAARACNQVELDDDAAMGLLWDAAAQAYDSYSRYLDAVALARWEAASAEAPAPVRGRTLLADDRAFAHVQVPSFYVRADGHSAAHDARELWAQLVVNAPSALLLDLRGNAGGDLDDALRMLDWLGHGGPQALAVDREGARRALGTPVASATTLSVPIVVLVDAATSGEAELVAAVLRQAGAPVVGQATRGKATRQSLIHLDTPNGGSHGALRVTVEQYYLRCGDSWQLRGVQPTHPVDWGVAARIATERELAFSLPEGGLTELECGEPAHAGAEVQAAIGVAREL